MNNTLTIRSHDELIAYVPHLLGFQRIESSMVCLAIGGGGPTARLDLPDSPEAMRQFVRESAVTYWHQSCTAKMGRDAMSVVNAELKVYGIENLRIADASIMPRITTGNTMAPCVVIGERAAELIKAQHRI